MAKWNSYATLAELAVDDLLPASDTSQSEGSRSRVIDRSGLSLSIPKYLVAETAHGLSVGNAVRFNGTAYVEATADTTANAEVVGLVAEVPDVDTLVFQQVGYVTGLSGLTAGDYYYLQDAGGLGTTAGTVRVPMLLADTTTSGWLVPISVDADTASFALDDLTDVDLTTAAPSADDVLAYDGADWVPVATVAQATDATTAERVEETVVTANSGASYAVDCSAGSAWVLTLTDSPTLSFSNVPTGGYGVTLVLTQDGTGSRTVTWPAAVAWAGGSAPTLSTAANAVDVITLFTPDSGTTWYGFAGGLDFS